MYPHSFSLELSTQLWATLMQLPCAIIRIIATLPDDEGCAASMMAHDTTLLEALVTAADSDIFRERALEGPPQPLLQPSTVVTAGQMDNFGSAVAAGASRSAAAAAAADGFGFRSSPAHLAVMRKWTSGKRQSLGFSAADAAVLTSACRAIGRLASFARPSNCQWESRLPSGSAAASHDASAAGPMSTACGGSDSETERRIGNTGGLGD